MKERIKKRICPHDYEEIYAIVGENELHEKCERCGKTRQRSLREDQPAA